MGVGNSPGVVTTAIAYMENNRDEVFKHSSGGGRAEALVLAGTEETRQGKVRCRSPVCWNRYGTAKFCSKEFDNVVECIRTFLTKEYPQFVRDGGRVCEFWYLDLRLDDPWENLRRLAKACAFMAGGQTGKELWINLTGGLNLIQVSLLLFAQLCREVSRAYYVFAPYDLPNISERVTNFLQPVGATSNEFRWIDLPIIPAILDENWRAILKRLNKCGNFVSAEELLGRLKASGGFFSTDSKVLRQQYLLKMRGTLVLYDDESQKNRISPVGSKLLELLEDGTLAALMESDPQRRRETISKVRPRNEEDAGLVRIPWDKLWRG